ncbi:hypothetical protein [Nonomuraea sp. bgisy101]|uniref:hypothetical protein n=1 Tax=Nonomuraea sp. bgisy101 TaxID=3413784 RepID=UPI003D723BE6
MSRHAAAHDAYAQSLGLYLGDGHLVQGRKRVYRLSIYRAADRPGVIEETATVMSLVMPTSTVNRRTRRGCTEVTSQSTHWACLFPRHGLGVKHRRPITLGSWQRSAVEAHPERFVRGTACRPNSKVASAGWAADGCRSMNRVRRALPGGVRWYPPPPLHERVA